MSSWRLGRLTLSLTIIEQYSLIASLGSSPNSMLPLWSKKLRTYRTKSHQFKTQLELSSRGKAAYLKFRSSKKFWERLTRRIFSWSAWEFRILRARISKAIHNCSTNVSTSCTLWECFPSTWSDASLSGDGNSSTTSCWQIPSKIQPKLLWLPNLATISRSSKTFHLFGKTKTTF